MRRLRLSDIPFREITSHGSTGFKLGGLGFQGTEAGHAIAQLEAGGCIGAHPGVGEGVLIVLRGGVEVTDDADTAIRIGPGSAVTWHAGEMHKTCALLDSLLMIIEGDLDLDDLG